MGPYIYKFRAIVKWKFVYNAIDYFLHSVKHTEGPCMPSVELGIDNPVTGNTHGPWFRQGDTISEGMVSGSKAQHLTR